MDHPIRKIQLMAGLYALGLGLLFLTGCAKTRPLMPAPNIYQGPDAPELFSELQGELQSNEVDLLYVTDRKPETDENGQLAYGYGRSFSMAFGSAIVAIKPDMPWQDLERISLEPERSTKLTLQLKSIEERGRFVETPWPVLLVDQEVKFDPAILEQARLAERAFQAEIRQRLQIASKPEVVMFVHGFNNDFEYAAETLAELWHFLGREHIPILYTWPAGRGGPAGYNYDRESGEFTIFHLKNLLSSLADIREIEKIHLVAHSRGADVLMSAVRELVMASKAAGEDTRQRFRIENMILAAPDLDIEVVSQRFIAERLATEVGEVYVYTSQGDRAISLAERLFKSVGRLGRFAPEDLPADKLEMMKKVQGVSIIELKQKVDQTGHGYFHSSPEASSDLILTIRYGYRPGDPAGRPLKQVGPVFWMIEPGYPHSVKPGN